MQYILRVLALENANTISKGNLAFVALKSSASENCKGKYCNFFLQYCYSTILKIELHCSSIIKKKLIFYLSLSHLCLSSFISVSHFSPLSLTPTLYLRLPLPVSPHQTPSNSTPTPTPSPPLPPQFHP